MVSSTTLEVIADGTPNGGPDSWGLVGKENGRWHQDRLGTTEGSASSGGERGHGDVSRHHVGEWSRRRSLPVNYPCYV